MESDSRFIHIFNNILIPSIPLPTDLEGHYSSAKCNYSVCVCVSVCVCPSIWVCVFLLDNSN